MAGNATLCTGSGSGIGALTSAFTFYFLISTFPLRFPLPTFAQLAKRFARPR